MLKSGSSQHAFGALIFSFDDELKVNPFFRNERFRYRQRLRKYFSKIGLFVAKNTVNLWKRW